MRRKLVLLAALAWAVPARAEWLPAQGRSFSRATSASRDAPVLELAYGPRSYGSIGLEPALYAHRSGRGRFVVGFSALLAFENEDTTPVVPDQPLWRDVAGAFVAHAFGDLEIAGFLGHEASFAVDRPPDAYRPTDIPFGGGGWFVAPDIALRSGVTASVELTSRLGDRLYTNFFPALVGQREESDYVADFLREGSSQMPSRSCPCAGSSRRGSVPSCPSTARPWCPMTTAPRPACSYAGSSARASRGPPAR